MCHNANALGSGPGDHARASASFLTGAHPASRARTSHAGVSADQVAAQAIGKQTRLRSLELGLEDTRMVGLCDAKYSCAYTSSISWRTPTTPLPPLTNPRTSSSACSATSIRTWIAPPPRGGPATATASSTAPSRKPERLTSSVGPADRRKLDEYLKSIREVERGLQRSSKTARPARPGVERPSGTPADYAEHARLMFACRPWRSRPT